MKHSELVIRELKAAMDASDRVLVVHYACEDFYDVKDRPAAISCIAFADLSSVDKWLFSVVDAPPDNDPQNREQHAMERYFEFLKENAEARLIHWNMSSADFSFDAIENRYRYLNQRAAPRRHPDGHLINLNEIIRDRHGRDYADHPQLTNLGAMNGFRTRYLLSGQEEAKRFKAGDHGEIRRSTAEKVAMIAYLARKLLDGSLVTKSSGLFVPFASATIDSVQIALSLGARFLEVSRQLCKRHADRSTLEVKDEYDAQDLYCALLRIFFADVRKEEWTPSYAGSASRIDFLLPLHKLAIELKHTRESTTQKRLGEELIVDRDKYRKHQDVRHLVCLVFDHEGYLENPRGIEADLSGYQEGLAVSVRIFDR